MKVSRISVEESHISSVEQLVHLEERLDLRGPSVAKVVPVGNERVITPVFDVAIVQGPVAC